MRRTLEQGTTSRKVAGPPREVGLGRQVGHDAAVTLRPTFAMAALAASLAVSTGAMAQGPSGPPAADLAAARALFAAGVADEQAGHWADALSKIRRASAVKMTPGIRFHLALCEERLGHLVAAYAGYTDAQAAARAENNREVLDLVSDPLRDLKVRLPTVTVNLPKRFMTPGSGAEVRLDGVAVAPAVLGTPAPVDVGSHTIQATAPGQTPYAMTVTVVERQAATLDIQFLPLGGAVPVPTPVVATTPSAVAPLPAATETPPMSSGASPSHGPNTLAIVATAGAVALVGLGIGAFAAAGSDQSYWNGYCQTRPQPCGNATPIRAWDATALGAWIAGAGVGALAVVLWTHPPHRDSAHAELRAGPGSLFLSGTF